MTCSHDMMKRIVIAAAISSNYLDEEDDDEEKDDEDEEDEDGQVGLFVVETDNPYIFKDRPLTEEEKTVGNVIKFANTLVNLENCLFHFKI